MVTIRGNKYNIRKYWKKAVVFFIGAWLLATPLLFAFWIGFWLARWTYNLRIIRASKNRSASANSVVEGSA